MSRRSLIALAVLAALMVMLETILTWPSAADAPESTLDYTWLQVPLYVVAVLVVLLDKGAAMGADAKGTRRAMVLILVAAAVLRVILIPADPESSDIYRYVWDGRVQGAGINPYRYIPADPALEALRDDDIYPDINRKSYAPTIYPPLAQIVFFLTTRISQDIWVMKAVMTAFDGIAILALLLLLRARGMPPTRILLYAWHPVPIWEFAGDGHVDAVAVACICLALLATQTRRPVLAGIALAGATVVKFFPILLGPALYRRWDWKAPLAGVATILVLYLPYLGAGSKLLGFTTGYSAEEGYDDGSGVFLWLLAKHLVPGLPQGLYAFYAPAAAFALVALGLAILFRERSGPIDLAGAFVLAVVFVLFSSPHYVWYVAWLIPFLCFYPSWAVIWLTGSATLMNDLNWPANFSAGMIIFGPFLALAAIEEILRRSRDHGFPTIRRLPRRSVK